MPTLNLLYKDSIEVAPDISIMIPKVGEILKNEDKYYWMVGLLTAMPIDMMVQLDDLGKDFTTVDEFDLFTWVFNAIRHEDTRLVFGDLDISKFDIWVNNETNEKVLLDPEHDITIDRRVHNKIATVLRNLHHYEKDCRSPLNEEARRYMLQKARKEAERKKRSVNMSQLESLIIALVNTEQCKYDFEGIRELTIYQFNESVRQIINKVDYDNRMYGVYSGTISVKDLRPDDMNWLTHK